MLKSAARAFVGGWIDGAKAQHHPFDLGAEGLTGFLGEGSRQVIAGGAHEDVDLLLIDPEFLRREPAEDRLISREPIDKGDQALMEETAALQLVRQRCDIPVRILAEIVCLDIRIEIDDDVVLNAVRYGAGDGVDRFVLPAVAQTDRERITSIRYVWARRWHKLRCLKWLTFIIPGSLIFIHLASLNGLSPL